MPTEILPGVYDVTVREAPPGRRYRAYLIADDVPTLFDAGFPDTTDALFEGVEATGLEPERLVVTHADGDRVGNFEAVHVPGHSRDHHALVDEERGVLVAADAVSGADLRGFPEGYLLPHAAVYAEDLKEAELNLDRLLEYEFDAALVYHGTSVTEGARDVLDRYVNFPGRPDEPIK